MRGESLLADLEVTWDVPDEWPSAAGGLEYLGQGIGASSAQWTVSRGSSDAPPKRYDAFFGDVRVALPQNEGPVHVWSPNAELWVNATSVRGVVSGPCILPASLALHWLVSHWRITHLHASLFELDGTVVLAPGASGAGKTTTALAVGRFGGELLSDDTTYLTPNLEAWGVRRPPHVTPQVRNAHKLDAIERVEDGLLEKYRVPAPSPGPATPRLVAAVLFPRVDATAATHVEQIDPAHAFAELIGSSATAIVERTPERDYLLDTLARLAERPLGRLVAGADVLDRPKRLAEIVRRWIQSAY